MDTIYSLIEPPGVKESLRGVLLFSSNAKIFGINMTKNDNIPNNSAKTSIKQYPRVFRNTLPVPFKGSFSILKERYK